MIDVTVAVKPPVVAPAATNTLAGTVSKPVLLDKPTTTLLKAALFSVTVQVEAWAVARVEGKQLTPDNCTGATRPKAKVRETLLALAVSVAF